MSCNIPLDFAIIADTSGSISRKNFQRLQNFIRGLVDSFQVDEDYTHIAIIEYSTTASVQLHFNDLSGKNLTRQNVKEKVQSMPHKRGYTYIDRALRMADRDVFTYAAGMRYNVDKVNIYILDHDHNRALILRSKRPALITCWLRFKKASASKILVNHNVLSVCPKNSTIFISVVYEFFFDSFFLIF